MQRRLAFGALALIPGALLALAVIVGLLARGPDVPMMLPVELVYLHVVTQLVALGIYANLLTSNSRLSDAGKLVWGALFLGMAPVALPTYWYTELVRAERASRVSVATVHSRGRGQLAGQPATA